MRSVLCFFEVISCPADYDLFLELDIVIEDFFERKLLGLTVDKGNHDCAEGVLKLCIVEKLIENNLGISVPLEVD